jgi:hypothetical protein
MANEIEKPRSLTELAMIDMPIPGTSLKAPFIVVGLIAAAVVGGSIWIYLYNTQNLKR